MNNEYLRSAFAGSILKMTERSDIHKSSIFNLQSSIFNIFFAGSGRITWI
ncbi:hypothetical protein D1AOALGA4SA_11857 [Olavius algarvensis Delta 1 endosymbiont]|nr:hypothetical protein D1AOALGA4SA_11857 [Olavius algarvensis Delta 1 endosymbiont]